MKVNKPNMLLFVGEALVGNDGIDQLMMFNKVAAPCGYFYTSFTILGKKLGAISK